MRLHTTTVWRLLAEPERLPAIGRRSTLAVCAVLLGLVAWLDQGILQEVSFSVFYLFPVATAAWFGNRLAGVVFGLCGAVLWAYGDQISGRPYSHWAIPHWNTAVRLIYFVVVADLVGRLRALLARERLAGDTDLLTGVFNRAGWFEAAEIELARMRRELHPLAVAFIDLDDFKRVNDTEGHAVGDRVLRQVASVLRGSLRRSDVVGRLGGDEFVVLLPDASAAAAQALCIKLHAALAASMGAHGWPVGFSVGVAPFEQAPQTVQQLVSPADKAMYAAKRAGKRRVSMTAPAQHGGAEPDEPSAAEG